MTSLPHRRGVNDFVTTLHELLRKNVTIGESNSKEKKDLLRAVPTQLCASGQLCDPRRL
jgi:hypothetical protein